MYRTVFLCSVFHYLHPPGLPHKCGVGRKQFWLSQQILAWVMVDLQRHPEAIMVEPTEAGTISFSCFWANSICIFSICFDVRILISDVNLHLYQQAVQGSQIKVDNCDQLCLPLLYSWLNHMAGHFVDSFICLAAIKQLAQDGGALPTQKVDPACLTTALCYHKPSTVLSCSTMGFLNPLFENNFVQN